MEWFGWVTAWRQRRNRTTCAQLRAKAAGFKAAYEIHLADAAKTTSYHGSVAGDPTILAAKAKFQEIYCREMANHYAENGP
jgi:hypothetical protein